MTAPGFQELDSLVTSAVEATKRYIGQRDRSSAGSVPADETGERLEPTHQPPRESLEDISILREKYRSVSEHLRALDKVANWVLHRTELLADDQAGLDPCDLMRRMKEMLEKAIEPAPSRLLIQADLDAARRQLGQPYADAYAACCQAFQAAWRLAGEAAGGQQYGTELNAFPLTATFLFKVLVDLTMEPADLLLKQLTRAIATANPAGEDSSAYRPASEFLDTIRFKTPKAINAALKRNSWIRWKKPYKNRLMIHAGDWHKFLRDEREQALDALHKAPEVVEGFLNEVNQRRETIKARKEKKRQE
jgi:hypothetical protein